MNKRDIEDVKMQGRETAKDILEEARQEMGEKDIERMLGDLWRVLPDKYKEMLAMEIPELADEMEKSYGTPWHGGQKSGGWPGKG